MQIASFIWDPSPGIDLGFFIIRYYSLMFVIAFSVGWLLTKKIYKNEGQPDDKLDSLFIYVVVATLVGARLGHVFFYQPELLKEDFFSVFLPFSFKNGFQFTGFRGLASHGAAIGIPIALYFYAKKHLQKPWLFILDRLAIMVALAGFFIRFGNFFNSEIYGKETVSSFGVIFKAAGETVPRHPTQLYEAFSYLTLFFVMWYLYWKTDKKQQTGYLFGLFMLVLWSLRFFIEFLKEAQIAEREDWVFNALNTGQILSVPLVMIGLWLMFIKSKKTAN